MANPAAFKISKRFGIDFMENRINSHWLIKWVEALLLPPSPNTLLELVNYSSVYC